MEGGDVSSSQPKLPSPSWFICILLCIHLHATFWKGPTFFSPGLSLISRVSVCSLNTPFSNNEETLSSPKNLHQAYMSKLLGDTLVAESASSTLTSIPSLLSYSSSAQSFPHP